MNLLQAPVTTERAVSQIERLNKIAFYCDNSATKGLIKKEAAQRFNTTVKSVNVRVRPDGRKVAVLTLSKPGEASSLASKLKIL